ncbi:MAG: hypothetical protein ACOYXA_08175 [Bacteroidota bacterium]
MRLLTGILLLALFIGCSRYQYVTLNSTWKTDSAQSFTFENDTLKIQYGFAGRNGPVQLEVLNKFNGPLYIDWSKSAVIVGDKMQTLWRNEVSFEATSNSYNALLTDPASLAQTITTGRMMQAPRISFLPPQAAIRLVAMPLQSTFFKPLPKATARKVGLNNGASSGSVYSFSQENSPMFFRGYLTLSSSENFSNPITLDNKFWVEEIMQTSTEPALVKKANNQFYVEELTGFGTFLATIAGLVVLTFVVLVGAAD